MEEEVNYCSGCNHTYVISACYIQIHTGCLSPDDHDEILIRGRRDRRNSNGCDDVNGRSRGSSSYHFNLNDHDRTIHGSNDNEVKSHNGRGRHGSRVTFRDGIEEKQRNQDVVNSKYPSAMFSLQNCTLHCNVCRNGETYWASFTERSFHRGHRFKLYRGIINGQGPQSGEKCVVKVFLQRPGTEELCRAEVRKSERLRHLARGFNQRTQRLQDKIRCPQTFMAPVDEVSKLKQLFFTGERKLLIGESVLFEPDIRITDDKPGKLRKVSRFMDARGKQISQHVNPVLNAFVHYTYHVTNGELVACGLEGVSHDEGFSLTTPIIHSKDQTFGEGDLGEWGIVSVFNNHVCNSLCHDLTMPLIPKAEKPMPTVTAMTDEVKEDEVDIGESSSMMDYPQSPEDITSPQSEKSMNFTVTSTSKVSEGMESMGGYIVPTAPDISDCLPNDLIEPPPAYTRERAEQVSHWLIQEEASNSFLRMCPRPYGPTIQPLPPHAVRSLSMISQASMVAFDGDSVFRRSADLNANFPPSPSIIIRNPISVHSHFPTDAGRHQLQRDLSTATTDSARSDEVMETNSTTSAGYSSYLASLSSGGMSEPMTARSDSAIGTSGSSCGSPSLVHRGRQESTCSTRGVDNALFQDSYHLICQAGDNNRNTRTPGFFPEQPPPYTESEADRHFFLENGVLPSGPN